MLSDLLIRVRSVFNRRRVERELDEELRFHVEHRIDELVRAGLTREDATRHATRGLDRIKEECRDARGVRVIDELRQDVSYAVRVLRRRKASSAAAAATLAIGVGLNAAAFSIVDWVLLRPLPFPAAHELVAVVASGSSRALTPSEFESISRAASFRSAAAFSPAMRVLADNRAEPVHIVLGRVAGDFFGTFGISPTIGRPFSHSDLTTGTPVAAISESLWRRRWNADPRIDGTAVTIDGRAHTIVAVIPADRAYPPDVDVWRPLTPDEREDDDRDHLAIARLAASVSTDRATVELTTLGRGISGGTMTMRAEDLQGTDTANVRVALIALLASTGIILLMACANVAALLAAAGVERTVELGLRRALGATRARLVRQVLTETVLLAVIGGAAGLLLGRWTLDVFVSLAPATVPRLADVALDRRIVIIGVAASLVIGAIVALVPARSMLFRGPRRTTGRRTLVAVQAALAVVLTVCAALLARSLQHQVAIEHGFASDGLVAITLDLRGAGIRDARQLFEDLIESAEGVPGVRSAAAALRLPTQVIGPGIPVTIEGQAERAATSVMLRPVTPGYFETAGITIRAGRTFSADDRRTGPRVAIVNAAFVRQVLQGGPPLGMRVRTDAYEGGFTIVGEAGDVTPGGESDRPALYVPNEQVPAGGGSLLVRTIGAPSDVLPALVTRLRRAAPTVAFDRVDEVGNLLAANRAATRFNMRLASAFAVLALLLAAVGVYGLTAGEVAARWRELGVRLALGATRADALLTVGRASGVALAIGTAAGLGAAFLAARSMRSILPGIEPGDAVAFWSAPALFAIVGMAATIMAASRVRKADPAAILRSD